ncbi:hypothetical protein [Kineosporia sp. NBRC 101731]|uniref:hypothetical protein n=1 Tax=Kineosporia sp. NBRC 101731 TaxID=3032199 RepID=UPI0024A5C82F|nr:hypothetical protein [Kineosporia sp. NBRC 101731]GLY27980.1 hypothetical protein Kisp02_13450 [Kineosporia sp. NBRC 101731]
MGGKVEVDPSSLTAFAKTVNSLAADHAEAAGTHPEDLETYTNAMFDESLGFPEARTFSSSHATLATSVQRMLTDVIAGFESLGNGAEYCAFSYTNSDQRNAAAQRKLDSALGPDQANELDAPRSVSEEILIRKEENYMKQYPGFATEDSGYGDDGFELTTRSGRTITVAPEPGTPSGN